MVQIERQTILETYELFVSEDIILVMNLVQGSANSGDTIA